ncbi:hypothetical protein U1Q18_050704 [Sarracenia purpurea var. burkii]
MRITQCLRGQQYHRSFSRIKQAILLAENKIQATQYTDGVSESHSLIAFAAWSTESWTPGEATVEVLTRWG